MAPLCVCHSWSPASSSVLKSDFHPHKTVSGRVLNRFAHNGSWCERELDADSSERQPNMMLLFNKILYGCGGGMQNVFVVTTAFARKLN